MESIVNFFLMEICYEMVHGGQFCRNFPTDALTARCENTFTCNTFFLSTVALNVMRACIKCNEDICTGSFGLILWFFFFYCALYDF